VERLSRAGDLQALSHLERGAAWRLAGRLGLDDDQRYSLISHHADTIAQLAARARPDLAPRTGPGPARRGRALPVPHLCLAFLSVTVGWAACFGNRRSACAPAGSSFGPTATIAAARSPRRRNEPHPVR